MYLLLRVYCYIINTRKKSKIWNDQPSVRLCKAAIQHHLSTEQHKNAVKAELLQWISFFHEQLTEKRKRSGRNIGKAFAAIYWLAMQETSNKILLPLIDLIQYLGVKELKFFEYRHCLSNREMFLTKGQTIRELLSTCVRKGNAYGTLADEACGISVIEHKLCLSSTLIVVKLLQKLNFLESNPCVTTKE